MTRAIVLVMDSFRIGASADASKFGDEGADTFGHIIDYCVKGEVEVDGVAQDGMELSNLCVLSNRTKSKTLGQCLTGRCQSLSVIPCSKLTDEMPTRLGRALINSTKPR